MASHVVVIDSAARRTTVKTTPNKHLSDILEEACTKLGFTSTQYGLKHNNKAIDLSRTVRLAGLSAGAKLELVQISKTPGVVSVALQLPESEARGVPNARLTDKFPSTTTLWLLLRKFEAGVAGGGEATQRNITARGAPSTTSGNSGAGRLYYQQPVLQIMNRELASFSDLQKTLAQIGLNNGSALIRLAFRNTTMPIEEAMAQIQEHFNSSESSVNPAAASYSSPATNKNTEAERPEGSSASPIPEGVDAVHGQNQFPQEPRDSSSDLQQSASPSTKTPTSRPVSVFRPPTSPLPTAALSSHNPDDYTPTVEHAQTHQRMLSQSSRNIRLPTEAEIAAQATAEAEKLASIKDVEIKVRFPDQSAVSAKFKQSDTASDLYHFVRECLIDDLKDEAFILRDPGTRGKTAVIPKDTKKRLIKDLSLKGRVLVIFGWDDTKASVQARSTKSILKEELRAQATDFKVQDVPNMQDDVDDPGIKVNLSKDGQQGAGDLGDGKKKMPKWLNKLSKK